MPDMILAKFILLLIIFQNVSLTSYIYAMLIDFK